MESKEPDLNSPAFWLSKSPDRVVLAMISIVFTYWQMVNTLLLILKSDANTKNISLQDGRSLGSLLEDIEQRHKEFYSNVHVASQWVSAYKKGEISLEPYQSPYNSSRPETPPDV